MRLKKSKNYIKLANQDTYFSEKRLKKYKNHYNSYQIFLKVTHNHRF